MTFEVGNCMTFEKHYFIRGCGVMLNLPKSQTEVEKIVNERGGLRHRITIPDWLYLKNQKQIDSLEKQYERKETEGDN